VVPVEHIGCVPLNVPALGGAVTVTIAVSVHEPLVHTKPKVPVVLNEVMVVVGLDVDVMVAVPGFPERAAQVPVPLAAIVADPLEQAIWSAPAFGLADTTIEAVSVHPLPLVQMKL